MKTNRTLRNRRPESERISEPWGMIAWLEDTQIELPLKGVEARLEVCGRVATVEIDQIFHQNTNKIQDVTYSFPLPSGAALYLCEMLVNDRVISAKSKDIETARQDYQNKVEAGFRASLVQRIRDNLFELALGNLAPGDTVVIRLAYCQLLEPTEDHTEVRIPFCPGIRYVPGRPLLRKNSGSGTSDDTDQVPDASRISPPRIDALDPQAAYVSISAKLNGSFTRIASPSHTLVIREAPESTTITLGDSAAVPDQDFVLHFTDAAVDSLKTSGVARQNADHTYALLTLQAPSLTEPSPGTAVWAQDVYFLVDRSGSMCGEKWIATSRAFRQFLANLAPQDRAWVTFFESDFQDLAEKPLPPAALLEEPLVKTLESWSPEGGTELLPAMRHVLERCDALSAGRRIAMVLITDGQVGNENAILQTLRRRPDIRIHTFGIDTCVNDAFLKSLAKQQRGTCGLATPGDNVTGMIAALGARMRRPILTEVEISTPGWEWPDAAPGDIYEDDSLTLVARGPTGADLLVICGKLPDGSAWEQRIPLAPNRTLAIAQIWAQQRIALLEAQESREEAIVLATEMNLPCRWTAFVAWDEAEKFSVHSKQFINQPSLHPAGWSDLHAACSMPIGQVDYLRDCCAMPLYAAQDESPPPPSMASIPSMPSLLRKLSFMRSRDTETVFGAPPKKSKPLIEKKSMATWRPALEATWSVLTTKEGQICLDWLEQWSISDPTLRAKREKALNDLVTDLSQLKKDTSDKLISAFRQWAQRHLHSEPAFLKAVEDFLAVA